MGLFRRKSKSASSNARKDSHATPATQVEMMEQANIPVFLSKMHAEHPPRWVTVRGDRLESVVGFESREYMNDPNNHEVWAFSDFVAQFPFVKDFLNSARPDQTALFSDQSGSFVLEQS